jgi:phycocyanobilin lyase beta subunit
MSNSLPSLIQAVDSADSAAKLVGAVRALAATGDVGAVPTLVSTLGYNNPGAAVAAVDGLIAIGDAAVPALLEQLDRHNYTARSWAIRALAGIGDPRGLVTLLGAATADFAVSVRRAAARGLGGMKWQSFPPDVREMAQEEVLDALVFAATQDDEWVVRYASVVGLESLAVAVAPTTPAWFRQITEQMGSIATDDTCLTVRARCVMAQRQLNTLSSSELPEDEIVPSGLTETDWQRIMGQLYERKKQERQEFSEGDPRRFRAIAADLSAQ